MRVEDGKVFFQALFSRPFDLVEKTKRGEKQQVQENKEDK